MQCFAGRIPETSRCNVSLWANESCERHFWSADGGEICFMRAGPTPVAVVQSLLRAALHQKPEKGWLRTLTTEEFEALQRASTDASRDAQRVACQEIPPDASIDATKDTPQDDPHATFQNALTDAPEGAQNEAQHASRILILAPSILRKGFAVRAAGLRAACGLPDHATARLETAPSIIRKVL